MTIPVQVLRSTTPGNVPSVAQLTANGLAINEADGLLFWLSAAGTVQSTALLGVASQSYVQGQIAALVNGSPTVLDTLKELADALGDDANYAATTATALGNRLRVDAAQGLSTAQKKQARVNSGIDVRSTMGDANYGASPDDRYVGINAAFTAPRTLTLPAASAVNPGHLIRVADEVGAISAANPLTVARSGGTDALNGAPSMAFTTPRAEITFSSDGVGAWSTGILGLSRGGTGDTVGTRLADGQCQLNVTSGTLLTLSPKGGQGLFVGGAMQTLPSAGLTLANTGFSASTKYYIYVVLSGGVLSLSGQTTAPILGTDGRLYANNGSGAANTNYRLGGMVYVNASGQFGDGPTFRGCLSYFNRRALSLNFGTTSSTTASTTAVNILSSLMFLSWGDEAVSLALSGSVSNTTVGQFCTTYLVIDGSTALSINSHEAGANYQNSNAIPWAQGVTEGVHTVAFLGSVSGGTGTWNNPYITGIVRG